LVSAQDASELGSALGSAVASPEFEHKIRDLCRAGTAALPPAGLFTPLDDDALSWRKDIAAFIAFCRKGGFRLF
jgi:hypothetical protein